MGATKKVLWALVLVATVDLLVGKHVSGGPAAGADMSREASKADTSEMLGHRDRSLAAATRPEALPSKAFAQKR